jgi:beta-RFAP synthase
LLACPTTAATCRIVDVEAPCRLHFGLLAFGQREGRQYGGVGVMIDKPAIRLQVREARRFETAGPLADRAKQFARNWTQFVGLGAEPACRIDVRSAAAQHSGLGVGTQLGLSVAAGLNAWHGLPQPSPAELAISAGRGLRSAVGTFGFALGGLIVERGKLPGELIAPLDFHSPLPPQWRFVLIQPRSGPGLSGAAEKQAFEHLPSVPEEVTADLVREVRQCLLPAAVHADFEAFSASVYRYGRLAGLCFAPIQGGPYNGPLLTQLVERLRSWGITGVGQSSWGPTLFALLPDENRAQALMDRLSESMPAGSVTVSVAAASLGGATVECRFCS